MKRFLCLLFLTAGTARAINTVSWQKSLFDLSPMYTSTGGLLDASFTIELGTFTIAPDLSNIDQWATSWKLLSTAAWDVGNQTFGNTFTFNGNGTVSGLAGSAFFSEGEQAYLWVRSSQEMALLTDLSGSDSNTRWRLPSMTNLNAGSFIWELPTADTIIYGGVNGLQSGTPHTFDPGTSFRLQTSPIPEPGSALLFLTGSLLSLRRTRSKA